MGAIVQWGGEKREERVNDCTRIAFPPVTALLCLWRGESALYTVVKRTWNERGEKSLMQIPRITHNPAVMGGKPCIRGFRVTVGTILGLMASGHSRDRILQAYPYLEAEDIDAALAYAAWRMEEREEALVVT